MKTKKPILRLAALAALSFFTGNEVVAQTTVGAACGCPSYSQRVTNGVTDITTLGTWTNLPAAAYGKELAGGQNITLTCNKIWTINEKLYIGSGSTITIEPGTIIRGTTTSTVAAARALIIERGGKIMAPGTEDCPIIFTAAADVMDGVTVKASDKGLWGGVLICGKATNNLTLVANGPFVPGQSGKLAVADGVGVLEGFASSIPQDQFGASFAAAPTGYALGTSPAPVSGSPATYSFSGTAASSQNNLATSTLKLTADPLTAFYGALISGTGTAPATTVTAFSSSSKTVTLSNVSTANLSGTYTIGATRSTAASSGNTAGTSLILSVNNSAIEVGMLVTGTGIAANTTVTAYDNVTFTVTLSTASTAAMSGTYVFALPNATQTGDVAVSTAVTLSSANTAIRPGMTVSGTGIASGTFVAAINGTALTLSAAGTAVTPGATLTFGWSSLTAADVYNCLGATKIKLASTSNVLSAGMSVTGTGVAANTVITAVTILTAGTSISEVFTVAPALTGTPGSLTFGGAYPTTATTAYYPITTTTAAPAGLADGSTTVYVNYSAQPIPTSTTGGFNDDDNSGVMTYVSIRHSGANLLVGSEINGLTLASVGRGTKIEHIEIVSCADDNIEIFGGTVNLKYCTTLFGNDDMYDYDLGWTGKAQFLFGMKANQFTTIGGSTAANISSDNDNGFEADSDDSQSYNTPRSTPKIYNATLIGNDKITLSSDNSGLAGIMAKENTGGEIYNSLFANWRNGFNMKQSLGTASNYAAGGEAWHNWTTQVANPVLASTTTGNGTQILKVKCNTFVKNMTTGTPLTLAVNAGATSGTALTGADLTQFTTTDNNIEVTSLTGFNSAFIINGTSNIVTTKNDVVPSPQTQVQLGTGCPQAPIDGFFEAANYRGAFAPSLNNENWLSDWSYSQVLNATNGVVACPTDINNDGVTNVSDFLIFSGQFGSSCN
jgi:hypothetical protein